MATPGRIKRRFYFHLEALASEWVVLRGKDNTVRKIRVKPKQPRITFKETERSGVREFVRTKDMTQDGFPLYREVEEAVA